MELREPQTLSEFFTVQMNHCSQVGLVAVQLSAILGIDSFIESNMNGGLNQAYKEQLKDISNVCTIVF